ncbi:myb-like protein I isoform X2 [Polistes fuscatus]|uniref:myb-like protein I isoform X2 n=1 Tax=Polistes fuscatus TaxID=30207 RepID=UPI001CAA28B5|nr:myb-like protein I isoform X2 [Polistes fuscatus]
MDSNMSTAAFMHRSGGSSSSSSAGTGSSNGAGPGNPVGGGSRMAVIGVTRNVRLRRRGASGFGFSLRGGREYAAGFYISNVQPGGEAHRNGLRVGDQILRVNGYPVEDAVHQEVALLVKNQQVLVLKIRSVGMIPVKDNPNDPVTWHMVQQQQQQLQYNETGVGAVPNSEVRIRIRVGEKGRLGCGVCRGIVPGLTVQGTREGGPARAAGLKAGDVIIWCNGQRLTDLPFERAIEVMRGSAVLDLIVQRPPPNHLYDCPEPLWTRGSSGYDSETSSIVATSPSPLQNPSSSPQHHRDPRMQGRYPRDDTCNRNGRICCPLALSTSSCTSSEWSHVDQNQGLLVQNQNHRQQQQHQQQQLQQQIPPPFGHRRLNSRGNYEDDDIDNEPLYDPVAPRIDYEVHDFDANPRDEANRRLAYRRDNIRQQDVIYDGPADDLPLYHGSKENEQLDVNRLAELQLVQRQTETDRKTITSVVEVQSVCPPAPPPPLPYKWPADAKPMNAMGMQMGSTMSMGSTGSTETESSLESSCSKDSASTSSSLSTSSCEPPSSSNISFGSTTVPSTTGSNKTNESSSTILNRGSNLRTSPIASTDLSTAITQELQRRAQQRSLNAAKAEASKEKSMVTPKPINPEALRAQEQKVTHDKLMEEFKRAHRKMFNAAQQRVQFSDQLTEPEQEKRVLLTNGSSTSSNLTNSTLTNENKTIPNATNNGTSNNPSYNNNNNTTSSIIPPAPPPAPPAPPLPLPTKTGATNNEDSVEMQSIESFKLKESPNPVIPKPPPTYFPLSNSSSPASNGSPRHVVPAGNKTTNQVIKEKDHHQSTNPPNEANKNSTTTTTTTTTTTNNNNTNTNTNTSNAISPNGNTGGVPKPAVGKVAIRIGAYEGEAKQPAKLDFLAQQPRTEKNGTEEANGPVVSRLQNELAATLQRSNLRKKTEGENQTTAKSILPDNTLTLEKETTNNPEPNKLPQSTVEKLATALGNKVTIRVNPDDGGNR